MYGRRDHCLGSIGSFVPVFDKCSCDFSRQLFISKYLLFVNYSGAKDARDWKRVFEGTVQFFGLCTEMVLCYVNVYHIENFPKTHSWKI